MKKSFPFHGGMPLVLSLLCAWVPGIASRASAAPIVDWNGSYTAAYTSLVGTPTTGSGWTTYNYSDSVPKSPSSGDGYTGPAFYGAFSLENGSGIGNPTFGASTFGLTTTTQMRFGATANSGSLTARGLVFFKKEDFLNGSGGPVTFDENSTLALNINSSSPSGAGNVRLYKAAVYALVDGNWNWYLSQSQQSGTTLFTISDLADEMWVLYDVDASTAPLNGVSGSYSTAGGDFDDVGAVGLFFNYYVANQGGSFAFYYNSFTVDAQVVPEPSTGAALGMGALLLLLACRFNHVFAGRKN